MTDQVLSGEVVREVVLDALSGVAVKLDNERDLNKVFKAFKSLGNELVVDTKANMLVIKNETDKDKVTELIQKGLGIKKPTVFLVSSGKRIR